MRRSSFVSILTLLVCSSFGCQDQELRSELQEMKAKAEIEKKNEAIYRKVIDELNNGNTEVFNEFFAHDYAYYYPSNTQEPVSLEDTQEMIKTHLVSFPDYNWTIEELFAVKDRVVARISSAGTFAEDYQGVPATGDKVESSAIFIVRIKNGKVVEERREIDALSVMQQIGMELKPKEAEK
jgi:steroid delta-isomerase-like uncharacterized protein